MRLQRFFLAKLFWKPVSPGAAAGILGSSGQAEGATCEGRVWTRLLWCHSSGGQLECRWRTWTDESSRWRLPGSSILQLLCLGFSAKLESPPKKPKTWRSWRPAWWRRTDSLEVPSGTTRRSPGNHSETEKTFIFLDQIMFKSHFMSDGPCVPTSLCSRVCREA